MKKIAQHDHHVSNGFHGFLSWMHWRKANQQTNDSHQENSAGTQELDTVNTTLDVQPLTPPPRPVICRMLVLVLLVVMVVGPSMSYNVIGALSPAIIKNYGISEQQLGILFSVYSIPNIIIVLVAGVLIDKIGEHIVCIICIVCIVIGNLITLGNSYWFLLSGRIVYALGGDAIGIVRSALITRWFATDPIFTLVIASSCGLLSYRISSFIMIFAFPALTEATSLFISLIIVNVFVILSASASVLIILIDYRSCKHSQLHSKVIPKDVTATTLVSRFSRFVRHFNLGYWYWIACFAAVAYYGSIFSFFSYSNLYLIDHHGLSPVTSAFVTSLIFGIPLLLTVPIGMLADSIGYRLSMNIIGMTLAVVGFALFSFTRITPWIPGSLLGLSYSIVPAIIVPLFSTTVQEEKVGLAYGLNTSLINLVLAILPLIASVIKQYEYRNLMMFIILCLALVISVVFLCMDCFLQNRKIEKMRIETTWCCCKRKRNEAHVDPEVKH